MAAIQRIRIVLDGFPGGPGVSTFYGLNAAAMLPELKGLFAGLLPNMAGDIQVTYPTIGDIIDPLNGDLTGTWTADARAGDSASGSPNYAAPAGLVIKWLTGGVLDGHRLTGRTFVVPLTMGAFDDQGKVADSYRGAIEGLAREKVATMSSNFVIWHRPRTVATPKHPVHAGGYDVVTNAVVDGKVAILRSRRD